MKKLLLLFFTFLTLQNVNAQLLSESFDPTGFPPAGWTNTAVVGGATDVWARITITTNLIAPQVTPHSGAGMARYDAFNFASGNIADLATPALNMSSGGPYKVSFWMYRDNRYTASNDSIEVFINNTTPTSAGGTKLGGVWRHFADPPAQAVRGWYQYSFNIPGSFNTATNFIVFKANSDYGTEMIIDDVVVEQNLACSGTPTGGTANASVPVLCATGNSTLSLSGQTATPGITYQWQSSPAAANTFTNIGGATASTYAATGIAASTDFRCVVTCTNGGASANSSISTVSISTVPTNDLICNAITLVLDGAIDCKNTTCATTGTDPAFGSSTPNNTVWYTYTPTTTGIYNFEFTRPAGVSLGLLSGWLGIYTSSGGCAGTLTEVTPAMAAYDLPNVVSVTLTTPSLTAGTAYYFMVDGVSGSFGAYCVQLKTPPLPPGCTTNLLPANGATNVVLTTGAANISWNAVATATSYDVYFATVNPPTTLIGNTTATNVNVTGQATNTTYYWYVAPRNAGGPATGCNTNTTSYTTQVGVVPTNDACANATSLVCNAAVISGTTVGSVSEPSPGCGSNFGVWYTFVGDGSTVTITSTTTFDHSIGVYTGTCGALTQQSCTDNSTGTETNTFTSVNGTTYYVYIAHWDTPSTTTGTFTIGISCISCPAPTSVATNTITTSSANVTWTGTGTFILEYGLTGFTPGTGASAGTGGTVINPATSSQAITGLTATTAYQVYVRRDCTGAGNGYSANSTVVAFTTLGLPPANDEATGAITLTVGGTCTGAIYNNTNATQSALEPFPSCEGTAGYAGMWYKFVAPTSGSVKISCDEATGTFGDSRMALYSVTNPADYATYSIIACDDDNGFAAGARSLFYATGLISGNTYYVLVDLYGSSSTKGTYCVTVDELASSMLSSTAASCVTDQSYFGLNATYAGWISLVDAAGNLYVNVRQTAGTATSFSSSSTVTTGASRLDGLGQAYLNRNFLVSGTGATSADLQLFFLNTEVTSLGGTIAGYNVTRVAGATCNANFTGVGTLLTQTANGSANGVSYIQVTTPGFSNFYVQNSLTVLPISIESFKGKKQGFANYLDWKVTCTNEPSLTLTLERSADGRNFKTINNQNATATRCLQGFDFTDVSPLAGANYYRLKVTSTTGKIYYSTIVVLLNKEKGFELISVAPNPTKSIAILTLTSVKAGNINIVITDIIGKVVAKQTVNVIAGNNPIDMNFATLGAGTYTIAATNAEGEVKTTRFVKY